MIGVTLAIVFTGLCILAVGVMLGRGLCILAVGVMLGRVLDDLADNGLFIPARDVEADMKSNPPWPHADIEHWSGCQICQRKEQEESK